MSDTLNDAWHMLAPRSGIHTGRLPRFCSASPW